MAGGALIFLYQCGFWLEHRTWLEIPFWKVPAYLADLASLENIVDGKVTTSLKGLKIILEWILRLPSAFVLLASGAIGFIIGLD
jgi:hypothetical protein